MTERVAKKTRRNTRKDADIVKIVKRGKRKNWFSPELWGGIIVAQKIVNKYSAHLICKQLHSTATGKEVYGKLKKGTISRWLAIDTDGEVRWSKDTLRKVLESKLWAEQHKGGRPKILVSMTNQDYCMY